MRTYPVGMANVTLAIEDKLLEKSRQYASQRGTSLNALLREMLANLTNETGAEIEQMINRLRNAKGHSGGVKIDRESLCER